MIQKKICMLGAFAVGKTSLVARFVKSIFSDRYHTTLGVKVDKKSVKVEGQELSLILWDLAGEDDFSQIRKSYLRGSSGYILVADGTRSDTLDMAAVLQKRIEETIGEVPFIFVINKTDLTAKWDIENSAIEELSGKGWTVIKTSAKTGRGVEEAFLTLAGRMIDG